MKSDIKEFFITPMDFYELDLSDKEMMLLARYMKPDIKGIFIPDEFLKLDLTHTEMLILAIYKSCTEEEPLKCCVYTNGNIAEMINVNVQTVKKAKKRLKKLGYIRTNGGIKTYYQGINKGNNE